MVKNPFISQDIFAHPRTNVCTSIAQDNHGHRCLNNGQYKLSAENLFLPPSIKTLHATERGKLKLCSDVKFDFVRVLHAITIPPALQVRENVKIIAVPQTIL